ncbi:MAG TPA: MbcA/ParS/Xre antitoxin family protein [Candidatus Absconditabacterales bacterium]|nr:MbcA/ParS/Xre antitoxin family protein [Candidatus Absconditabacterales bacterium]
MKGLNDKANRVFVELSIKYTKVCTKNNFKSTTCLFDFSLDLATILSVKSTYTFIHNKKYLSYTTYAMKTLPTDGIPNDLDTDPRDGDISRQTAEDLTIILDDAISRENIFALGESIFGEKQKFASWLQEPSRALGNIVPLDILSTEQGRKTIYEELMRIQHGIFA